MGTVETGTLSQLLLAIPLQISAGCRCCWSQSRMKILLLAAALVSQVVGRPQQGEYQPMQPGNCGSGGCGQMPQPSRCQLGSGPQMGPLLGPIATTGCGASDRDMPTYGAPSNGWMPGNSWMTKPWPQQPAPMPMPMPEPMPSGNCGPGGCGQ